MADVVDSLLVRVETLRRWPHLLAALCGLLIGLAQPPFGFLPGLFGYAGLLWILDGDLGPRPRLRAFTIALAAGFLYFLVSCYWVASAFLVFADSYGWMAPFAVLFLAGGIALFWGGFGAAYRWLAPKGTVRFLTFAALFAMFEIARGTLLSGFPWNPAGAAWKAGGAMSQVASWGGVYGLSFITVAVFASVAVMRRGQGWRGGWPVLASMAVMAVCLVGGFIRLQTPVTQTTYVVRLVQPAIGQEEKWNQKDFDRLFDTYVALSRKAPLPGHRTPDLVIWPEGALPPPLEDLVAADSWTAPVLATMLDDGQSLIIGTSRGDSEAGQQVWRNSMMMAHQENSHLVVDDFYNKFKLVPFGEFIPLQKISERFGITALTHLGESFSPGPRTRPVSSGSIPRFLPLICFEGIFPALDMTNYRSSDDPMRPRWIVNISNDAWFGPTSGPPQHLNLASYRAIEEGLPMVRSTPTGISGLIDPYGRLVAGSDLKMGEAGFRDVTLLNRAKLTLFARFHGMNVAVLAFFCLILVSFETCVPLVKNVHAVLRSGGRPSGFGDGRKKLPGNNDKL